LGRAMEVAQLRTRLVHEERERRREHEEALLSQLAHDFGSNLDREATVRSIVQSTGSLMGDLAALWLVEADQATLGLADIVGREDELCARARDVAAVRSPRMGEGVIGRAAATATTVLVGPQPRPVADQGDPDGIDALGLHSLLAVPIIGRGRVRGVLVAARSEERRVGKGWRG